MGFRDTIGGFVGGSNGTAELELSRDDGTVGKQADVVYQGVSYWSMEVDHSPDQEYLVVYYEDEPIFVFEGRELQYTVDVQNANDAAVADDGTLAVVDWLSDDESGGKLAVYGSDGTERVVGVFDANLGPVAITPTGRYVATATFDPDCTTYVYDALAKKQVLAHENHQGAKGDLAFGKIRGDWVLHLADRPDDDPLYTIDMDGEVVGRSRAFRE